MKSPIRVKGGSRDLRETYDDADDDINHDEMILIMMMIISIMMMMMMMMMMMNMMIATIMTRIGNSREGGGGLQGLTWFARLGKSCC